MRFTHDKLHSVGRVLYGSHWQTELSERLDIHLRTVQRWASGETPVPDGIWAKIGSLTEARVKILQEIVDELGTSIIAEHGEFRIEATETGRGTWAAVIVRRDGKPVHTEHRHHNRYFLPEDHASADAAITAGRGAIDANRVR